MEYISNWTRGLIVIVILSSFTELLIPQGSIKKYVRFASGLIIMLLFIKPIMEIKNIELPKFDSAKAQEYSRADIAEIYVERLENNVEQALNIKNVEITVNPENLAEIIQVKTKEKKAETARYLGIAQDKVGD